MTQGTATAATAARRDLAVVQKILSNTKLDGDCLVWLGGTNRNKNGKGGYGVITYTNRAHLTHRLLFQSLHGVELDRREFVCHSCDNKPCCNPRHLWLGDNSSNIRDQVAKGKYVARHVVTRKTSPAQRAEIAARFERYSGKSSNAHSLATEYGITQSRVRQIVTASKRASA